MRLFRNSTVAFIALLLFFGCDDEQRAPTRGPVGPILPSMPDQGTILDGGQSDAFVDSDMMLPDAAPDMELDAEVDEILSASGSP